MTATTNYPYTTGSNYTYDTDKIEVTAGVAILKDIRPTGSTCAAMYDSSIDLSWGDGVLTGSGTGSPVITAGQLDLTGASNQYVDYDADLNADSQQVGCMRATIIPNYSGNPGNQQYFFGVFYAHDNGTNIVQIYQLTNGNMTFQCKSGTGSLVFQANLGNFNPTAGVEYVFEINFDLDGGASRFFINGVQQGSTRGETATRSSSIGLLRVGQHVNGSSGQSDFKVDNFTYFSTVQHTSNHASELPFDDPIKYDITNPTILTNTSFKANSLVEFTTTEVAAGSDVVTHIITASGQDRYVTGGSAADSDGTYAQSSSQSDMDSDIEAIIVSRKTITLTSFLHSDDGTTTPQLDLASFTYNASLEDASLPTLTELEGWIYTPTGAAASQTIRFRPYVNGFVNEEIFNQYDWETVATTDANGHFFAYVFVQPTGEFWEMKVAKQRYKLALKDQLENSLFNLPTFEAIIDE